MTRLLVLRPWFLALLLVAPLLIWAWRRWPPPQSPGRSRASLVLRLVLVTVLALAMADVRVARRPRHRVVVAVVDLSDSTRATRVDAEDAVRALAAAKEPDDLLGVVTFGRDAQVEVPPSRRPVFDGFQTRPDGSSSDLAGAVQLAANLMPDGYARQVLLVSDGRENVGDVAAAAADVRSRSVRVDVVPLGMAPGAEVLLSALDAPREVRTGQSFAATARLRAVGAERVDGRLVLSVDGRDLETRDVDLSPGESEQRFDLAPLEPGSHRLSVRIDSEVDGYSENDVAEAVVRVADRPSVLVLEGPGEGANLTAALEASGMRVTRRPAEESPTDVGALAAYDSVVVAGAAAAAFRPGALAAISTAVRDLGRGLVATGGPAAYGPGGWGATPLEEALPVRMEMPRPKERPAVAVALLMETMEDPFGDVVALGAANSVIDELRPDDDVAVLNMSTGAHSDPPRWVVPLERATDKGSVKQRISQEILGDPPGYGTSVALALDALSTSRAPNKHVVVLGDGDAVSDQPRYEGLFADASSRRITVSAVGVATHRSRTDMEHMRSIARLGGGRFFESESADGVPELLLEAGRSALRPWYEQDRFFPTVTSSGDLLEGVPLESFPELGGYVATTPKPAADVVLSSPKGDPVLASGHHGTGRTVAWTSDSRGRWTADLLRSPVAQALFGRMVAWTLPGAAPGGLEIRASPRAGGLDVEVSGPAEGGELEVDLVPPAGPSGTALSLRSDGPGLWRGTAAAPDLGTYLLHASLRRDGVVVARSEIAVAVPYSAEYLEVGRNDGLLAQVARVGGAVLAGAGDAWRQRPLPLSVTGPVYWLLLLVFAVLWPVDVALRRITLGPRQLAAAWRERRRQRAEAAPAETDLATRVLQRRQEADFPAPPPSEGDPQTSYEPTDA